MQQPHLRIGQTLIMANRRFAQYGGKSWQRGNQIDEHRRVARHELPEDVNVGLAKAAISMPKTGTATVVALPLETFEGCHGHPRVVSNKVCKLSSDEVCWLVTQIVPGGLVFIDVVPVL